MVMSIEDFAAAFPGEDSYVEFKQGVSAARLQDAAVAFSNADGGVLIVGVADDGRLVGVPQQGQKVRDVHQAMREVRSPGRYDVHQLTVDGHTLLVVSIARRHEGFSQTSSGAVLARRGSSNVALLGSDLSRFVAARAFESFELTPTNVKLADVQLELTRRLGDAYGWKEDSDLGAALEDAGFVVTESGNQLLTIAGALLMLADPATVGGRPYIDIRRYSGDDPDPDKVWEIRGPADHQVEQATRDILQELGSTSAIVGVQRVEMPKLPERAIREAIANAVAHRSYEYAGSAIRVEIRPTALSITSPGGLPEPVTVPNIRFQQAARNDRLLCALRRLGLAEDLGKGIDRMEDDMAAELLQPPQYEDDGSFFTVRLMQVGAVTARERAWVRSLIQAGRLDAQAALVVVAVAREGAIGNSEVRSLLDVDSVEARSILQSLVAEGVLVQYGQRGGTQYLIADDLGVPARIRYTDNELDAMALDLARRGAVTNSRLRQSTGLDRTEARRVLRRLVDQGELVQLGTKRGTRYQLP